MTQQAKGNQDAFSSVEILILEDEALMVALLKRYLNAFAESSLFKSLHPRASSKNFSLHISEGSVDLLRSDLSSVRVAVVDLLLPRITGVDLIRDFRRRFPLMGIVPISGMATEPMKRSLREVLPRSGMGLLPKPLRKEDFFDAFVRAWNFAEEAKTQATAPGSVLEMQAPQSTLTSSQEEEGGMWTAVQPSLGNMVQVERRSLQRKKAV